MNAIFSFTGIYFNIKNRPHHILSKDEAKVIIRSEDINYILVTRKTSIWSIRSPVKWFKSRKLTKLSN